MLMTALAAKIALFEPKFVRFRSPDPLRPMVYTSVAEAAKVGPDGAELVKTSVPLATENAVRPIAIQEMSSCSRIGAPISSSRRRSN